VRRRDPVTISIEKLSHEGRGIGHINGKTVFVYGALPGEEVRAKILRKHPRYDEAEVVEVINPSGERIEPRCEYFGTCGGCNLQHVDEGFQLRYKQEVLLELLENQADIVPSRVAQPIRGPQWGYRRKARLGVKSVPKKGGVLVGFRERGKSFITDCAKCDTLDPRVGDRLPELRALISDLSIPAEVPQIEVALGDGRGALIIRHLKPLTEQDRSKLRQFATDIRLDMYTQSGGLDSVVSIDADEEILEYHVDGLSIGFAPTEFTQVNAQINVQLVERALAYLDLRDKDHVGDLFCGVGNFTLPIARRSEFATGFEGEATLVDRGVSNAQRNSQDNIRFVCTDLSEPESVANLDLKTTTKLLLDPPRTGASTVVNSPVLRAIERIVYVSCNPTTFARDASILVRNQSFRLMETGIVDMFPQTAHVESISLFERR